MSILVQTVISAALAFVGFVLLLPTTLGQHFISLWFDQRLEAFKTEQNEKLARLQEQLIEFDALGLPDQLSSLEVTKRRHFVCTKCGCRKVTAHACWRNHPPTRDSAPPRRRRTS